MDSDIKAYYSHSNVLITGGTGLLGQLLVEKLLREVPDIEGIYLIIRGKKGKSATERVLAAYSDPLFNKLRAVNAEFTKKINVLEGDCSQLNLGLDETSMNVLTEKVNMVFHCAASLNMDARLPDAVNTNVRSLRELLNLCHQMSNLKSLMFVSTAYSNCIYKTVEEKFYKAPMQPDTVIKLTQELDPKILDDITPILIDSWPNTYCYSKVIAEEYIRQNWDKLPVGLFRPSVILPTHSEPVPGWTSNLYGPVGTMVASGLGILRVSYCNPDGKIDFVPADFCINALICTAWETHLKFKASHPLAPVYNYAAGEKLSINTEMLVRYSLDFKYPLKNAMWATMCITTNNRIYYYILRMFLHSIPGYLIDVYLRVSGQKPRMMKSYERLSKMADVLSFFTCQKWDILNDNVNHLWNKLNETDKKLYPFNMALVNYKNYLNNCAIGVKLYVMKETLDNVEYEKKRYQRLVQLHNGTKLVLAVLAIALIFKLLGVLFY